MKFESEQADEGLPSWFCGCGSGEAKQCLADILNAFADIAGNGSPYVNLEAMNEVNAKYGRGAVDLICYFLDHLSYAEHSGSVACSQWLTDAGEELRKWANTP